MINIYRNKEIGTLWAIRDNYLVFQWSVIHKMWHCMTPAMIGGVRVHCELIATNVKFK